MFVFLASNFEESAPTLNIVVPLQCPGKEGRAFFVCLTLISKEAHVQQYILHRISVDRITLVRSDPCLGKAREVKLCVDQPDREGCFFFKFPFFSFQIKGGKLTMGAIYIIIYIIYPFLQCSGSFSFWCCSGGSDLIRGNTDPDPAPDPTWNRKNTNFFYNCYNFYKL